MYSIVHVLNSDGTFGPKRVYSLPPAEAVVAALMADRGNGNTWTYPTPKEAGVRPSRLRSDVAILDTEGQVYAGFPE